MIFISGGGTFLSMNSPRVSRPGAYINFVSVPRPMIFVGDRGTSTGLVDLPWYRPDEAVLVSGMDFLSGAGLKHIGLTAFDEGRNVDHIGLLLSGCVDTWLMSANTGGTKATANIQLIGGTLHAEAQKYGSFGNDILLSIAALPALPGAPIQYQLITMIQGHEGSNIPRMTQTHSEPTEIRNNDFVVFTLIPDDPAIPVQFDEIAGVPLTGGSDGTVNLTTRIPAYLRRIKTKNWQCMGWHHPDESHKQLIQQFIMRCRDENGLYVQVSMATSHANHEGVNNLHLGHGDATNTTTGMRFTIDEVALMHASMTAGADIITSNTNTPLPMPLEFDYEFDNQEIIDGLAKGLVMFTRRRNGIIKIEQDINSLHTFTPRKNREFRKNNILRKLDEIGTTIRSTWENFFMGNEINDDIGRALYVVQVDTYFTEMQTLRAIVNHSIENLNARQGDEPDAVVMHAIVQPTDAMERLFLTVHVSTGVYFVSEVAA